MARRVSLLLSLQLALLLLTSSTHSSRAQAAITQEKAAATVGMGSMMMRALGSRPPSCEGRCRSCGRRCEAVQVPVTPQDLLLQLHRKTSPGGGRVNINGPGRKAAPLLPSSYDDHSNYKPLGWRCKCLLT